MCFALQVLFQELCNAGLAEVYTISAQGPLRPRGLGVWRWG